MTQTPVKIAFQGSEPSAALVDLIHQELAGLERIYGRLTSGQITVRVPDNHHRAGLFNVSIRLAMPAHGDVVVDHVPNNDDRFAIPQYAVNDAFKRARRQLQDRAKRMRGETKTLRKRIERTLDEP
jgi:hypothetical protein